MFLRALNAIAILASMASALDCSVKELSKYNFQSIKGEYSDTITKVTPPTSPVQTWSFGLCQSIESQAECPPNSDICGRTKIMIDGKETLTELIVFGSNLQKEYIPFDNFGTEKESGLEIKYSGVNWGNQLVDANVRFICTNEYENVFSLISWNGTEFQGVFRTRAACVKSGKNKKGSDNSESWGWFTWLFIFVVLFLSIYIIGGAWFQYNKGNAIDFSSALKEVLENFVDLMRGLPAFIKEIIEKFTGNSNRGEYSAV